MVCFAGIYGGFCQPSWTQSGLERLVDPLVRQGVCARLQSTRGRFDVGITMQNMHGVVNSSARNDCTTILETSVPGSI
ncbi:hypothetical protein V6N13_000321 [Hibiscus sabdariffa]|uniref:Uncharacterized protein n=1 Tax=Hibiscus sabdariffa TaxID=183260 RepID=A0ABR2G4W0_9ROSI